MAILKSTVEAPEFKILSSNNDVSSTTTLASQLSSAVNNAASSNASEDEIEELLWRLWNAIIATASRTPVDKQQYLSNLLRDIAAQGVLATGREGETKVWEKGVWTDLPVFGAAVREIFNESDTDDDEEQKQWININAFLARLTIDDDDAGGPRDFSLFGIWSLREAFEGSSEDKVPQYKIEAARAWMDVAGLTIEKFCSEEKAYDGKLAAPGPGYSDKQWKGYNEERLEIWDSQLQS